MNIKILLLLIYFASLDEMFLEILMLSFYINEIMDKERNVAPNHCNNDHDKIKFFESI